MKQNLIELAYEFLVSQEEPVTFESIWNYVKEKSEMSEEIAARKAGQFYTNLMLDGRFARLENNLWDLKSRHVYDDVHAEMDDYYSSEVDTADDDIEEQEEEKDYNSAFEDNRSDDDDIEKDPDDDDGESSNEEIDY